MKRKIVKNREEYEVKNLKKLVIFIGIAFYMYIIIEKIMIYKEWVGFSIILLTIPILIIFFEINSWIIQKNTKKKDAMIIFLEKNLDTGFNSWKEKRKILIIIFIFILFLISFLVIMFSIVPSFNNVGKIIFVVALFMLIGFLISFIIELKRYLKRQWGYNISMVCENRKYNGIIYLSTKEKKRFEIGRVLTSFVSEKYIFLKSQDRKVICRLIFIPNYK